MRTPSDSSLVDQWGRHRRRRRVLPGWALWILGLALLAGLALAVWIRERPPAPWRPPSGLAGFSKCVLGGEVSGWCAQVAVPEDPTVPAEGTIGLRVAVLPATAKPAAGALFYLEGGPGGAATESAISVNEDFAEIGRTRDLVMVDQRGTGGSSALACPDRRVRASDAAAVTAYLRSCFARLPRGVTLSTTSVAADDLDAVRRKLGYGRIDVYGGSYGATLAQMYLRRHPASVRTAILDGGSLPDVRIYERTAVNAERTLDAQLARCAADAACHRAFPDPRRELDILLARAPRPMSIPQGSFVLGPDEIAWTIAALSSTPQGAALIPFTVDAAVQGNYLALARDFSDDVGADLDARARLAMTWEILCSEPWAASGPAASARGSYLGHAAVVRAELLRRACAVVPKGRVPAGSGSVVASRAPVLLLAGGEDPLDPVANLRGWRRAFPNGRLVVVPAAGHGTIESACVQSVVARFVAGGTASGLDTACAAHVSPPPFLTG